MQAQKGGAWRTLTSGQAYSNGAWRTIANGQCFLNNRWRDVCNFTAPPPTTTPPPTGTMTLAVSPASSFSVSVGIFAVSQSITATPTGGRSPYTYVWSFTQSDGNAFALTNPAGATTAVTATIPAGVATCSIHCVCTDSTGLKATSADVPMTLRTTGIGVLP